ncbi:nucleosome assembly protein 1-like 1 [Drosophila eugracilis]|uniref:nucleosome assembly protein 1-like 1 n=1 Tax=Drosophila eugracilis TaxID=29029 RepID=UPI0007E703BC|nr:nucleosome assembly protein 1-like 1 [Drosophila eugracilis]
MGKLKDLVKKIFKKKSLVEKEEEPKCDVAKSSDSEGQGKPDDDQALNLEDEAATTLQMYIEKVNAERAKFYYINQDPKTAVPILRDANGVATKDNPNFWLTVFHNSYFHKMIEEKDEPALRCLTDITVKYYKGGKSFALKFFFGKNELFKNKVLTKKYYLKTPIDRRNRLALCAPRVLRCKGCRIHWEENKDTTIETFKQKRNLGGGDEDAEECYIFRSVTVPSFFNFFKPPLIEASDSIEEEDLDDDAELRTKIYHLQKHYEFGHMLRVKILPKAGLYFTGEIFENSPDTTESEDDD